MLGDAGSIICHIHVKLNRTEAMVGMLGIYNGGNIQTLVTTDVSSEYTTGTVSGNRIC